MLGRDASGTPAPAKPAYGRRPLLVAVPEDVEALRGRDPDLADGGGARCGEALGGALGRRLPDHRDGPDGWYVHGGHPMKLTGFELRRIAMPLVSPFRTSFGTEHDRDVLLVRAVDRRRPRAGASASRCPSRCYSSEYVDGAAEVIRRFLIPAVASPARGRRRRGRAAVRADQGPPDGQGGGADRAAGRVSCGPRACRSAATWARSATRVPAGVSVGIMDSIPELLDAVDRYLAQGYLRIKLKIEPGWDVEPVRAVRERFGDDLLLQVDANTAYTLADARHLARLDPFDLLLIEQPLPEDDIRGHAELARQVAHTDLPGRVDHLGAGGGRRDRARRRRRSSTSSPAGSAATWRPAGCTTCAPPTACRCGVGGMLETGLGRAANVALAALPNFTLPGDTSASDRYFAPGHHRAVRAGATGTWPCRPAPASASLPDPDALAEVTTATEWIPV